MTQLTIIANVFAKSEKTEFIRTELEKLIAPTRSEEGCQQYELHQDNTNPNHFLFYEIWESRERWQKHMEAPHLQAFKAAAEDAIEEITIREMTRVA